MKYLKIVPVIVFFVTSLNAIGQSKSQTSNDVTIIIHNVKEHNPSRPRVPSHEFIGFIYDYGVCHFSLPEYISYIDVYMENENGDTFASTVYAANPYWTISLIPGDYHIICTANEGSVFEGNVWIE